MSKPKPKIRAPAHKYTKRVSVAKHDDSLGSNSILMTLEAGKRFAHTAPSKYQLLMASLQPDERKQPNCACNTINKDRKKYQTKDNFPINDDQVILIIEHNLKEYILCVLDKTKTQQCKLNLIIQAGEQVAYKAIGKIPVLLSGISAEPH